MKTNRTFGKALKAAEAVKRTFVMIVEETPRVTKEIRWEAETPPLLICMDGFYYVRAGQNLSPPGNRYRYLRTSPIIIPEGF